MPELLSRSTDMAMFVSNPFDFSTRPLLVCWSLDVANQRMRGAAWHDSRMHCPSWSVGAFFDDANGCRCSLGDEA